jgi:phosphoenolpyruvate synthase/pyruvate phosphate dikinase
VGRLLELSEVDGRAGGKAQGLARLAELGLPVPPARVLPAEAYERWRKAGALAREDIAALESGLAELGAPLAVRSSASDEDTEGRSAAGQYESVMGAVTVADVVHSVERCFRAATSERVAAYRGDAAAELSLVIQREVNANRAGVAFSVDPLTGEREAVLVEAVLGHGERIVSGVAEPDRYRFFRATEEVRARIAEKPDVVAARRFARVLRDDEVRTVAALVLRAEAGFRVPVDVEFCFEGPRPWLVQCRAITTLDG